MTIISPLIRGSALLAVASVFANAMMHIVSYPSPTSTRELLENLSSNDKETVNSSSFIEKGNAVTLLGANDDDDISTLFIPSKFDRNETNLAVSLSTSHSPIDKAEEFLSNTSALVQRDDVAVEMDGNASIDVSSKYKPVQMHSLDNEFQKDSFTNNLANSVSDETSYTSSQPLFSSGQAISENVTPLKVTENETKTILEKSRRHLETTQTLMLGLKDDHDNQSVSNLAQTSTTSQQNVDHTQHLTELARLKRLPKNYYEFREWITPVTAKYKNYPGIMLFPKFAQIQLLEDIIENYRNRYTSTYYLYKIIGEVTESTHLFTKPYAKRSRPLKTEPSFEASKPQVSSVSSTTVTHEKIIITSEPAPIAESSGSPQPPAQPAKETQITKESTEDDNVSKCPHVFVDRPEE